VGGSEELGNAWVFVAIDAETKLIPSYVVGKRDHATTYAFLTDCADAGALYQKLNRQQRFLFGHDHRSEQPRMIFGVRLAALRAVEAL
jgi:hypothetical protein